MAAKIKTTDNHGNEVSAEFCSVTPDLAAEWLGTMPANQRNAVASNIEALADHMATGTYFTAGAPILFDSNGALVNGQNTLRAVIKSDETVVMLVLRGADTRAIKYLDIGAGRSVADILKVSGRKVENLSLVKSVSTVLMQGSEELRPFVNRRPVVADYIWEHREEIAPWATWAKTQVANTVDLYVSGALSQGRARDTKAVSAASLAALGVIMSRGGADTDLVTRFWEAVVASTTPDVAMGAYTSKVRDYLRMRRPLVRGGGTQLPDLFRNMDTLISVYNAWRLGADVPMGRDIDAEGNVITASKSLVKVTGGGRSITYISQIVGPIID